MLQVVSHHHKDITSSYKQLEDITSSYKSPERRYKLLHTVKETLEGVSHAQKDGKIVTQQQKTMLVDERRQKTLKYSGTST